MKRLLMFLTAIVVSSIVETVSLQTTQPLSGKLDSLFQKVLAPKKHLPNSELAPWIPVTTTRRVTPDLQRRREYLLNAGVNPFRLPLENTPFDLRTDDSLGIPTVSTLEARSGAKSREEELEKLRETCRRFFPWMEEFYFFARGGEAEETLAEILITRSGMEVIGTVHLEPGEEAIKRRGAHCQSVYTQLACLNLEENQDFAGNPNLDILRERLIENRDSIAYVMVMLTNNEAAGQPVSVRRLREIRELIDDIAPGTPLVVDAGRILDNAELIKDREQGYGDKTIREIVAEFVQLADALVISAKKNIVSDTGGILALSGKLVKKKGGDLKQRDTLDPGDLAQLTASLTEVFSDAENYYQSYLVRRLWQQLKAAGVPVTARPGGHAVYINASEFFKSTPNFSPLDSQGITLATLAYLEGGVLGSNFGKVGPPDHPTYLFRLALARRRWTPDDIDYIAKVIIHVYQNRAAVKTHARLLNHNELKKSGQKEFFDGKYSLPEVGHGWQNFSLIPSPSQHLSVELVPHGSPIKKTDDIPIGSEQYYLLRVFIVCSGYFS